MAIRLISFLTIAISFYAFSKPEIINMYTYHNHPPFINDKNKGLTYELEKYLNVKSGGKYKFEVKILSRKRLDKNIKKSGPWIVTWVHPVWFGDTSKEKYNWINILNDAASIISRNEKN